MTCDEPRDHERRCDTCAYFVEGLHRFGLPPGYGSCDAGNDADVAPEHVCEMHQTMDEYQAELGR